MLQCWYGPVAQHLLGLLTVLEQMDIDSIVICMYIYYNASVAQLDRAAPS